MRELTTKQQEVLGFMRSFQARHGAPPTVREIAHRFKVTPRAAFDHLRALERKGALQRRACAGRTSRALTLVDPGAAPVYRPIPILGRIAAGSPLLAEENREGELPVAPSALADRGEDVFALRVRGQSMIDAHIMEGDLVLVRRQETAQPNDIVVGKPEAPLFHIALERLGLAPAEAAMVGDSLPSDIAGARAVGMRTVLYAPAGAPADAADLVVGSFAELAAAAGVGSTAA